MLRWRRFVQHERQEERHVIRFSSFTGRDANLRSRPASNKQPFPRLEIVMFSRNVWWTAVALILLCAPFLHAQHKHGMPAPTPAPKASPSPTPTMQMPSKQMPAASPTPAATPHMH